MSMFSTSIHNDQTYPEMNAATLPDILTWRAEHQPDRLAYIFLGDGETEQARFTYRELAQRAWLIAQQIESLSSVEDRVLLLYPPGLEYIAAFFACLYTGRIAVPAYPPRLNRPDARLQAIVANSGAVIALTTTTISNSIEQRSAQIPDLAQLRWLATDNILNEASIKRERPAFQPDVLAFLQYTSGSTAAPKGACVTHQNLMHNAAIIQNGFELTSESCVVSWLPPYHDMGLIGSILEPLYVGCPAVLMAPLAFLQSPIRWLQAISRYKGTASGGPNFAYDFCVNKITPEQRAALDLSSWTVAFNGAEPVRAETLIRFGEAFGPSGFRPEAFYPCYGLAEGTLIVSGSNPATAPLMTPFAPHDNVETHPSTNGIQLRVSSGRVLGNQQVTITHPETFQPCPSGQVGEIWVKGGSVVNGYWNRPDETAKTFAGRLANGNGPFLRTGDLGFLHEGELFISGRLKDLMIIRGRNHYPQDIELTVEKSHPALQQAAGAAFTVQVNNEERLVVVNELERQGRNADVDETARAIRQAVAEQHGLQVYAVSLLRPGNLPRTSSGKVARRACLAAFLDGTLAEIGRSYLEEESAPVEAPPTRSLDRDLLLAIPVDGRRAALLAALRTLAAQMLHIAEAQIDLSTPFVSLGFDSLLAAELAHRLDADLAVSISMTDLLGDLTLAGLADQLLAAFDNQPAAGFLAPVTVEETGEQLLSFEQERLWLLNQRYPESTAYNIPLVMRLRGVLNKTALQGSLNEIVRRHASLRTLVKTVNAQPVVTISPAFELSLLFIDLETVLASERESEARQLAADETQRLFDLAGGPLIQACLIRLDQEDHLLVITAHHIVSDLWSMSLIFDELGQLYPALLAGEKTLLPELPVQYPHFVNWQRREVNNAQWTADLAYWKDQLTNAPTYLALPTDYSRPAQRSLSTKSTPQTFEIDPTLTQALNDFSRSEGVTLFMTLLTAFSVVLQRLTRQNDFLIGSPVAGRPRTELERLIGFFAYPVIFRLKTTDDFSFRDVLQQVRQTALTTYAHQNVPFTKIAAAAHPDRSKQASLIQVMFGFLNQPLQTRQWAGLTVKPIDIGAGSTDFDIFLTMTHDEQSLHGVLAYDPELFMPETIQQFVEAYQNTLKTMLEHPAERINDYRLPERLELQAGQAQQPLLAIAASFTAEPVKETLALLMQKTGQPAQIQFSPYHQIYQQLLDPASLLSRNMHGVNILLLRFEDWLRFAPNEYVEAEILERNHVELISAVKVAAGRSRVPFIISLCPASPTVQTDAGRAAFYQQMENQLKENLAEVPGVYIIQSAELLRLYPVANYYDALTDREGHIPYKPVFFTALGTMLARRVYALQSPPYKVIVLDCDQTLWKGVCGEDGASAVEIDAPRKALQTFMLAQHQAGMLLCLNSKNNEADVWNVFNHHTSMPLRREHLVAWKINWQPKSENLRALAQELQLGLDSFIFVDDNPAECAEVQANCPEVLTLQLPADVERIPRFLSHVWAFDHLRVTDADQQRTVFYQQNAERERLRQASHSFEDFLAGLGLEVQIAELESQHLTRVAQLTLRTNQFNFTSRRWAENELKEQCLTGKMKCLTVHVQDRFGDYGLVGVVILEQAENAIVVNTCLLSCRVLGRGVEQHMLAHLGKMAQQQGRAQMQVYYRPTDKNQPAADFLERVGKSFKHPQKDDSVLFIFPAEIAATLAAR